MLIWSQESAYIEPRWRMVDTHWVDQFLEMVGKERNGVWLCHYWWLTYLLEAFLLSPHYHVQTLLLYCWQTYFASQNLPNTTVISLQNFKGCSRATVQSPSPSISPSSCYAQIMLSCCTPISNTRKILHPNLPFVKAAPDNYLVCGKYTNMYSQFNVQPCTYQHSFVHSSQILLLCHSF